MSLFMSWLNPLYLHNPAGSYGFVLALMADDVSQVHGFEAMYELQVTGAPGMGIEPAR